MLKCEAAHALEEQAVAELPQSWQEGVLLTSPILNGHFDWINVAEAIWHVDFIISRGGLHVLPMKFSERDLSVKDYVQTKF